MSKDKPRDPKYRQPPVEYRFPKGHSGNSRGRPKGAENLHTMLDRELQRQMIVTEKGKKTRVSHAQLAIRRLVKDAVGGNPRALKLVLEMCGKDEKPPSDQSMVQFIIDGRDVTHYEQIPSARGV